MKDDEQLSPFEHALRDSWAQTYVEKLARAVYRGLGLTALLIGCYVLLVYVGYGKDVTDPPNGVSGLSVLTDYGTGCEYLFKGSLTPRLNAEGRQMGCKQ